MPKVTKHITLDYELNEWLKQYAEEKGTTQIEIIEEALREYRRRVEG